MSKFKDPLIEMLKHDRNQIIYRPELNKITGSVCATILLQQIIFRQANNEDRPFYKFKEPCNHELYKKGDSWIEELSFSRREYDGALAVIAMKVKSGQDRPQNCLVWYWITNDRRTYYEVNFTYLRKVVTALYVKCETHVTKSTNCTIDIYTETTTETTTEIESIGEATPSSPDEDIPADIPKSDYAQAEDLIIHLALATGNTFLSYKAGKPTTSLKMANARIKEYGLEKMKLMVDMKVKEWKGDEKMEQYLVPTTLFKDSKAEKYMLKVNKQDNGQSDRDKAIADLKRRGLLK